MRGRVTEEVENAIGSINTFMVAFGGFVGPVVGGLLNKYGKIIYGERKGFGFTTTLAAAAIILFVFFVLPIICSSKKGSLEKSDSSNMNKRLIEPDVENKEEGEWITADKL